MCFWETSLWRMSLWELCCQRYVDRHREKETNMLERHASCSVAHRVPPCLVHPAECRWHENCMYRAQSLVRATHLVYAQGVLPAQSMCHYIAADSLHRIFTFFFNAWDVLLFDDRSVCGMNIGAWYKRHVTPTFMLRRAVHLKSRQNALRLVSELWDVTLWITDAMHSQSTLLSTKATCMSNLADTPSPQLRVSCAQVCPKWADRRRKQAVWSSLPQDSHTLTQSSSILTVNCRYISLFCSPLPPILSDPKPRDKHNAHSSRDTTECHHNRAIIHKPHNPRRDKSNHKLRNALARIEQSRKQPNLLSIPLIPLQSIPDKRPRHGNRSRPHHSESAQIGHCERAQKTRRVRTGASADEIGGQKTGCFDGL